MRHKGPSLLAVSLAVLACSLLGGFFGPRIPVASAASEEAAVGMDDLDPSVAAFAKAYALVERDFADKLSADKAIYKGAIPGMLRTLDPHSNFFDPKEYQLMRDDQRGRYYGVGMVVGARSGKTVVSAPFPGSPAYKAGIRPGDIITKVNDKPTDNLSTSEVADLLKGPRGTEVKVLISREGAPDLISFALIRDEIFRKSVPDAFFIKKGIAYLSITSFGEKTSQEMDENLKRLGEDQIEGLVLDLRANPGGLLNEGVAVADRFLQKNQVIVSHRGRASAEKPYVARNGNKGRQFPIVVLVNRRSASAAEIVSGALQDHDRAWILGEKTFGKGLVQTVFPLDEGTGLALTTAHFYTPSGRLIQRDYTNKSFFDYYYHRDEAAQNDKDVKMTDSGRTVYGGGGITPDEKYEAPALDKLQVELRREWLFDFSRAYFGSHSSVLPAGWMPDHAMLSQLHSYLLQKNVQFTEADFVKDSDWITRDLAKEMYTAAFNVDVAEQMFARTDPEVLRAVDAMPKATALIENARKVVAQRLKNAQPEGSATAASSRR
jgi:carboxyl-terminal processing protease